MYDETPAVDWQQRIQKIVHLRLLDATDGIVVVVVVLVRCVNLAAIDVCVGDFSAAVEPLSARFIEQRWSPENIDGR